MSANLGWLFYGDYFDSIDDYNNIDEQHVSSNVDRLIASSVHLGDVDETYMGSHHFKATTTYPGLLLGIGNMHELPSVIGQAILGFHFDYTTGLPEIPGSSIKGSLRSAFAYPEYIREWLKEMGVAEHESIDISQIEREIFGQSVKSDETHKGTDIFFDAPIIGYQSTILADDYLAPHGDDLTQEPDVLRFIKVNSGVTFRFDFGLSDKDMLLSKDERISLYGHIIDDLGLGAKTNVGYGYFEKFEDVISEDEKCQQILALTDVVKLREMQRDNPNIKCIEEIESHIENLLKKQRELELRETWESLDKSIKTLVDNYIERNEQYVCISDIIKEAKEISEVLEKEAEVSFDDLMKHTDFSNLQADLQKLKVALTEVEKTSLIEHIKGMKKKPKKAKFKSGIFKEHLGEELGDQLWQSLFR